MMSATIAMKLQLNVLLPFVSDHDGMWNEEEKWRVRAGNPKKEYNIRLVNLKRTVLVFGTDEKFWRGVEVYQQISPSGIGRRL